MPVALAHLTIYQGRALVLDEAIRSRDWRGPHAPPRNGSHAPRRRGDHRRARLPAVRPSPIGSTPGAEPLRAPRTAKAVAVTMLGQSPTTHALFLLTLCSLSRCCGHAYICLV